MDLQTWRDISRTVEDTEVKLLLCGKKEVIYAASIDITTDDLE